MTDPAEKLPEAPASGIELTRDQRRSRRKCEVRSRTINIERSTKRERRHLALLYPQSELDANEAERPRTRGECANVPRPCPYVSCAHHLYLDVTKAGNLKLNFPDIEPEQMHPERSCALDVADRGGVTLEEVGEAMNMTRERVRQIEERIPRNLTPGAAKLGREALAAFAPEPPRNPRSNGQIPALYALTAVHGLDALVGLSRQLGETPLPEGSPHPKERP